MRARRWTSALIVAELALTLVLLAGAGFMMRSFLNLYRLDLGIDTSQLLTMRLTLPNRKYPTLEQRHASSTSGSTSGWPASRGIEAVTITSNAPLAAASPRLLSIDGKDIQTGEQAPNVTMLTIDPHYFETLGIPVLRGRAFDERRHARPRHRHRQSTLRGDALRRRGSDRPAHHADAPTARRRRAIPARRVAHHRRRRADPAPAMQPGDAPDPVAYLPLRAHPRRS